MGLSCGVGRLLGSPSPLRDGEPQRNAFTGEPGIHFRQHCFQSFAIQPGGCYLCPPDFVFPDNDLRRAALCHNRLDVVLNRGDLCRKFLLHALQLAQLLRFALQFCSAHCCFLLWYCRLLVPLPLRLDARSAVYWYRPYRGGGFCLPARPAPVKSSSCCWYCNSRAHITSLGFLTFARLSALPGRFPLVWLYYTGFPLRRQGLSASFSK